MRGYGLLLPDAEDLGPTDGTCPSNGRPTVFQGDVLGVLYLPLGPALEAISLHCVCLLS